MNNQNYKTLLNQFKNCKSAEEKAILLSTEKERINGLSIQESINEVHYLVQKVEIIENNMLVIQHGI